MDTKPLPLSVFAIVTLLPLALLGFGLWRGGALLWGGFLYMTVLVLVLDQILPLTAGNAPEGAEFPAADGVLVAVALGHLLLLPLAVWALGTQFLGTWEKVALFFGAGAWFGQVAHPAAHELIHRGQRGLYRLGVAIYVSLLIGHHASAHRLVHHRAVATPEDPNSAQAGESFWRFLPRAWLGSYRAGRAAEAALRTGRTSPYLIYWGGALACLGLAWALAGPVGPLLWLGIAAHAQLQLFLADYVQHYGLTRRRRADGRYEPVGPQHAWNTRQWCSSALMLNAPRHSDHHSHPARPYPALRLPDQAPQLPWPLPLACALALAPRLWRRAMRPHLTAWHARHPADPAPSQP
jgi:alkane 1-monooxygenase